MNKGVFLMITMLLLQNLYGQQSAFFDLEPKHTQRKLKEYKQSPQVYAVNERQLKFTTSVAKKRIKNQEYEVLESEITSLENDSIQREMKYQFELGKFSQVSKIKILINDFLSSTKPYELKKEKLITAQKLAQSNNVNELIYADKSINTELKNKFFVLQLNKLDLKVHLKKVTRRLDQIDLVKPSRKPSALIDQRLKDLRTRKRGVKQYNYLASKPKTVLKNGLITTNKIDNIGLLEGQFKQVGFYYVLKNNFKLNFKKGQLISAGDVAKFNLDKKGYVGPSQVLFQNVKTKNKYITQSNFLNRYAFSINGKFNNGQSNTALVISNSGLK